MKTQISWYGLFLIAGAFIGFFACLAAFLCEQHGKNEESKIKKLDILCGYLFQLLGMTLGAKLLYILTNPASIRFDGLFGILTFIFTGFSFYGAIFGGIGALYLYCRIYKLSFSESLKIFIFSYPVIYGIARVGCFLAGCCYGIPYTGVCCLMSPSGICRFPVQLLEVLLSFTVWVIMVVGKRKQRNAVKIFFLLHGLSRFFLEFLRDGGSKTMLGILSVNQWISILLIAGCLVRRGGKGYKRKKTENF